MIEQYYANPNKTVYKLPHIPAYKNTYTLMDNGMSEVYNKHQAHKKGVSIEEFVRRDKIVRDAAKGANYLRDGDVVYPHNKEEYAKYGKLVITYVLRSYADYELERWDEKSAAMVIGARPERGSNGDIVCTSGYVSRKEPV